MEENQSTDGNGRDLRNKLEGGAFTPVSPEDNLEIVPPESVEILQSIGLDLNKPQEVARFARRVSVSGCPYPSPDMLFAYDPQSPDFPIR